MAADDATAQPIETDAVIIGAGILSMVAGRRAAPRKT